MNNTEFKDSINISIGRQSYTGLTYLEKHLAIDNIKPFNSFIGNVVSIRSVRDFFTKRFYPTKFLTNIPRTKEDYNLLKKCEPLKVPNIQAILVLAVIQKIKQDKQLKKAMAENTLPYVAYGKPRKTTLFGRQVTIDTIDFSLSKYCDALDEIGKLLRNNEFNDTKTDEVVRKAMLNPNVDLFHGSWINIHEINNEKKEEIVSNQIEKTTNNEEKPFTDEEVEDIVKHCYS